MNSVENLKSRLTGLSGRDYGAYQSLLGSYQYADFLLSIDQIPKDPYAPPHTGIYRVRIPYEYSSLPQDLEKSKIRSIAFRDFLVRRFYLASSTYTKRRGTGYSGLITVAQPGQAILERTSVVLLEDAIELRFFIGLPAKGRKIDKKTAETMLFQELPSIIEEAFKKDHIDLEACTAHLECAEMGEFIRSRLEELQLVSFIADGAVLPRSSGTSDEPMEQKKAVPFTTPRSLRVVIELPNGASVTGMGVPKGITLVVGGGYHGKSTLLQTIAHGIYNHVPGDGREQSVTNSRALKIRAYSGRYVEKVNISPFISNLPGGTDTTAFSTENASGSTSQAASLIEGLEAGAEVLLMDEDTCASNFMIRDEKMQQLVQKEDEPITPFIDRARQLFSQRGVSTILVLGGSGDYFEVSDTIIHMKAFVPFDVTEAAHAIEHSSPVKRKAESLNTEISPTERIVLPPSIDPFNQYRKRSVYATEVNRISFGRFIIDLTDVEQILELEQTKGVMNALQYIGEYIDGNRSLKEILECLQNDIETQGLDVLSPRISGNLAAFRPLELASALNRLRSLETKQRG